MMTASDQVSLAAQSSSSPAIQGTLTVFAAASLTESFRAIGERLQLDHTKLDILFHFAGSQTLRTQLEQGAPADVFVSANVEQMRLAQQSGVVEGNASIFTQNQLVLIVPQQNPGQVEQLRDLANPGLKLILAGQHVPAGRYSRQVLQRAARDYGESFETQTLRNLVSEERNVKQVVTKIQLGEADAGLAYVSDVTPQVQRVIRSIPIPDAYNAVARYPIAVVQDTSQPAAAKAFIDFVRSKPGQAILKSFNFVPVVE